MRKGRRIIVVKIGTSVLSENGGISEKAIKNIAYQIAELHGKEQSFILVSSGAILSGITILGLNTTPHELSLTDKQVCASIGQPHLMSLYEKYFKEKGIITAQILFTEEDLANQIAYKNVWRTLNALLKRGVIPIINENDAVSVKELLPVNPYIPDDVRFGDNDRLSAIIASKVKSKMLIILSDVDGYYEIDPDGTRRLVNEIKFLNNSLIRFAKGHGVLGRGGMKSKLEAAKIVAEEGIPIVIANGKRLNIIKDILNGAEVGTKILPVRKS